MNTAKITTCYIMGVIASVAYVLALPIGSPLQWGAWFVAITAAVVTAVILGPDRK